MSDAAAHYRDRFGTDTRYVPNGVDAPRLIPAQRRISARRVKPSFFIALAR